MLDCQEFVNTDEINRRLRFVYAESEMSRDELITLVAETGREQNWTLHTKGDNFIVAKTHPSMFSGSWGEQVTILSEDGTVLVNSICDPDKKSSVTSMGRNTRNEKALIEKIKKANANKVSSKGLLPPCLCYTSLQMIIKANYIP